MSPAGATAVLNAVPENDDVIVQKGEGLLTRYHEKHQAALEGLVREHGITILTKSEWDARKTELGEKIYS